MTINKLIKHLQEIEKKHGKRIKVLCAAREMVDCCNGVFTHVGIGKVSVDLLPECNGDGFIKQHDCLRVVLS